MISKFKYIIFDGTTGFDGIIFPPYIEHDVMAGKFPDYWTPLSAGFVEITENGLRCFGNSNSLKLKALEGDEAAFDKLFN